MLSRYDFEPCGKTGTAQNRGHDHSVFMGFAPMNNPKIAIAVYVENGGWGADYGVPIGGLMMEAMDRRPAFQLLNRKTPEELFSDLPTTCYIMNTLGNF